VREGLQTAKFMALFAAQVESVLPHPRMRTSESLQQFKIREQRSQSLPSKSFSVASLIDPRPSRTRGSRRLQPRGCIKTELARSRRNIRELKTYRGAESPVAC
jgi:hypothetical protein